MKYILLFITALILIADAGAQTHSPREFLDSATAALGAENLDRIEYSGDGWEACVGQPWNINQGWARWSLSGYRRVIDYENTASLQTAQRQPGMDPGRLGGCGAQPGAAARSQQTAVTAASDWVSQLQIWLTPHGFLKLAREHELQVTEVSVKGENFTQVSFSLVRDNVRYLLNGYFDESDIIQQIETWIDNPVFGDMLVEAEFSNYQDFDGVLFPVMIVQKQGGFTTLALSINEVIPHSSASVALEPVGGGRFGGPPGGSDNDPFTPIGPGIFVVNGAYQAVAVEFEDFSVVIDGMQNTARTREVIKVTGMAIPGKPIRYIVNTHAHFDHASGLRDFIAEGATIITHKDNVSFYEKALLTPRTLNPGHAAETGAKISIIGIDDMFSIQDDTQRLELHHLQGHMHADDMLIAFLPGIKTVVESDLLQPWINPAFGGGAGRSGPHLFLLHLADELEQLGLDYEQFVPVHRPNPAPVVPKEALMTAIGRN